MNISNQTLIVLLVLIVIVIFVVRGCSVSCSKREGYTRSCLGNDCNGLQRTPVDYAFKHPHGWQRNPHYKADPHDEHQPLDYGPVDLWKDARKLDDGRLFKQYGNWWKGCGRNIVTLANDEKNRFDLTNVGDQGARQQLDDMYNPRFGPMGYQFNERTFDEPNPYFDKIYGGASFLKFDRLGD